MQILISYIIFAKKFNISCYLFLFTKIMSKIPFVYCSATGNDSNSGTTPDSPVKSIAKALSLSNTVYLKRGDTFYENIYLTGDRGSITTIAAYGQGSRPILSGMKKCITYGAWTQVKTYPDLGIFPIEGSSMPPLPDNLWKIDLVSNLWVGYKVDSNNALANNIGTVINSQTGEMYGAMRVKEWEELGAPYSFWQPTTKLDNKFHMIALDCKYLYMCFPSDPNGKPYGFSVNKHGIASTSLTSGLIIKDLEIYCWGQHGLAIGPNTLIENCVVDAVGGSLFLGQENWAPYGNGIEHYITNNSKNITVKNNIVSRCFDAGITAQGSGALTVEPEKISFCNNLIFNCCQGWECFLRSSLKPDIKFKDSVVENNVFISNGKETGFRYAPTLESGVILERGKFCQFLNNSKKGNEYKDDNMILKNNICIDGNFLCYNVPGDYKTSLQSNTVKMIQGQLLITPYFSNIPNLYSLASPKRANFSSTEAYNEAVSTAVKEFKSKTGTDKINFEFFENSAALQPDKDYWFNQFGVVPKKTS